MRRILRPFTIFAAALAASALAVAPAGAAGLRPSAPPASTVCPAGTQHCNPLDNFWRSLSNLTLNVHIPSTTPAYAPPPVDAFGAGCVNTNDFWAASQAAPIRRAIING